MSIPTLNNTSSLNNQKFQYNMKNSGVWKRRKMLQQINHKQNQSKKVDMNHYFCNALNLYQQLFLQIYKIR
eukprot:UN04346